MKKVADGAIALAGISLVVAVVSRFTMKPVAGIFAGAILEFSGVCLLLAIAILLREK